MTLALPFRIQAVLATAAYRMGRMPTLDDMVAVPVEERRALKPNPLVIRRRPAGVTSVDQSVPGRDAPVPVRIYRTGTTSGRGLLYIHGGGFSVGGVDACDHICADIAHLTGDVVVSVDYRLAPDDPFPAGLDDCEDALRWMVAEAVSLDIDPTRVAAGGDSAAGNLSAALCLRLQTAGDLQVTSQVLIYPMLDLTCSRESWISEGAVYLPLDRVREAVQRYHGDADVKDPCVSPLFASDLDGLPPALIITAQHDTLRDDGADYAEALERAGVVVRLTQYSRMPHGFLSWQRLTSVYDQALWEISSFLRRG